MKEQSEQITQKFISDYLDSIGAYSVKVIKANRAGVPDILCCLPSLGGRLVGVEVKKKGGVVSALQKYHIKQINDAGGLGLVAYSVQDVKDAVEQFKEMI